MIGPRRQRVPLVAALVLWSVVGCSTSGDGESDVISRWNLFAGAPVDQHAAEPVLPYDVISPLYSDYADKMRFIRVPEGETVGYRADGAWDLPSGTVLVKTFALPADERDPVATRRLIETRLLVREGADWTPYVYRWNDDQTEAVRLVAGDIVPVEQTTMTGETRRFDYRVPNENQCRRCHAGHDDLGPIGLRTQEIDRDYDYEDGTENQIERLARVIGFTAPPAAERTHLASPFGDAPVADRARGYLDANCAHCHREGGAADNTGLWLGADLDDALALGICRRPSAAGSGTGGHDYDIVPGDPDSSIMIYRMRSTDPEIKMPELPNQLVHEEGVALIAEFVRSLSGTCE